MSLILPLIGAFGYTVTGGASGNFTFSLIQDSNNATGNDPAAFSLTTAITAGNLLVALCGMRSDRSHTNFAVSDNNSKTWTKLVGGDNELGDTNARSSAALFWRVVDSSGETDTTPLITFDDTALDGGTTNEKFMQVIEVQPSATYAWTASGAQILGAGTGEWDDGSNPSASATGDDIFELAVAFGRHGTSSNPTEGGTSFATQTDGVAFSVGTSNDMAFISAFEATSQAAGSKSADLTSDSTGCEGLVGIATWSDG